jgi:TM2 domain-containing membrane protein YozV
MDTTMLEIRLMRRMTQDQKIIFQMQQSAARKSPSTALILSLFSLSRFYLGQAGLGVLQWLSVSFFGIGLIWVVVDILTATSRTEQYNADAARRIAGMVTGNPVLAVLQIEPPQPLLSRFNDVPLLTRIILALLIAFAAFAFYKASGL